MKIILIEPSDTIVKIGIRQLSSNLKLHGHKVNILFIPRIDLNQETQFINGLKDLISDADLIGISVTSCRFIESVEITRIIKNISSIPVIWGGIHATASPEESLKYADMVCIGEGEESLLDLITKLKNGTNLYSTKGIWFKNKTEIIKNEIMPLKKDIDKYPFLDYEISGHFVFHEGMIRRMDTELFKCYIGTRSIRGSDGNLLYTYYTMWSRGCPHSCSYCCNNLFKKLYGQNSNMIRRRSPSKLIGELKEIKEKFPFISFINFFDDEFLATGIENIKQFCISYRNEVNLPFKCNFSPSTVTDEKLKYLIDAGLAQVEIGIESGSDRINLEIYKRPINKETLLNAAKIINRYKNVIRPRYDIILDNPYEEDRDLVETVKLLASIPKPFRIGTFSLTFFPGTELYLLAKKEGRIKDELKDIYQKKNNSLLLENITYLKLVLLATPFLPKNIISFLISEFMVKIFNRNIWKKPFINFILAVRKIGKFSKFNTDIIKINPHED